MIEAVGPGGVVRMLPGTYSARYLALDKGGAEGSPVTVTGMPNADRPVLKLSGTDMGAYIFNVKDGANNLRFTGLNVDTCGLAVWKITGAVSYWELDNIDATNTRGLVYMATPQNSTIFDPTLDYFDFHDINIVKWSRGQFGLRNARHGRIANVFGDSQLVNGDPISVLTSFDGDSHDVKVIDCECLNTFDDRGGNPDLYWNSDHYSTEGSTYDIWFINCKGDTSVDACFDLKGGTAEKPHRIVNGSALNCKRGVRIGNSGGVITHVDIDGCYIGAPVFVPNADGLTQNASPGGRAYLWMHGGMYLNYRAGSIMTPEGPLRNDQIVQNNGGNVITTY